MNPGSGRSAGEGIGYPLQCSGLENSMHGVAKNRTRLSDFHFQAVVGENEKPYGALELIQLWKSFLHSGREE